MLEKLPSLVVKVGRVALYVLLGLFVYLSLQIFYIKGFNAAKDTYAAYLFWPVVIVWALLALYFIGKFVWWLFAEFFK